MGLIRLIHKITIITICLILFGCPIQSNNNLESEYEDFELTYMYAGLGSGMGSKQPVFKVKGNNFIYTFEQNSFYGEKTLQADTICSGLVRSSSIDSIIDLVKNLDDTLIYNTNIEIMSGGTHHILISDNQINLTFKLHNASDSIAEKIVTILNSNIPNDIKKLWLLNIPMNE